MAIEISIPCRFWLIFYYPLFPPQKKNKTKQNGDIVRNSWDGTPAFVKFPCPRRLYSYQTRVSFSVSFQQNCPRFPLSFQTNSSSRPFICLQSYYVGKGKTLLNSMAQYFFIFFFNHFLYRFSPIASWVFPPQNVPLQHMDKVVKGSTFSCVQRF